MGCFTMRESIQKRDYQQKQKNDKKERRKIKCNKFCDGKVGRIKI